MTRTTTLVFSFIFLVSIVFENNAMELDVEQLEQKQVRQRITSQDVEAQQSVSDEAKEMFGAHELKVIQNRNFKKQKKDYNWQNYCCCFILLPAGYFFHKFLEYLAS